MRSLALMCAVTAMSCSAAAWAVPPERSQIIGEPTIGEPALDCGDFQILHDYQDSIDIVWYFNKDGSPKTAFFKFRPSYHILYNSREPSFWLAAKASPEQRWWKFEYGDLVLGAGSVNFTVTAPGYGVVLQIHERFTINFVTGEMVAKGPNDVSDGYIERICAALRAN